MYRKKSQLSVSSTIKIDNNITKKRLKIIQNQLFNLQLNNNKGLEEKIVEVLVENKLNNQPKFFGRTKSMIPVIFESDNCKPGTLVNVKITSFNKKNLFGSYKNNKVKAA